MALKKMVLNAMAALTSVVSLSVSAAVIDFNGGTAYLSDGTTWTPTDAATGVYRSNVDYYIEDGVRIDFVGGYGIIGDYYSAFAGPPENNSVIHAHWHDLEAVVFSMVDGSTMDLNYVDLSSNTTVGGGAATGLENSHITSSGGSSVLLPSSDWGDGYLSTGAPGDGIQRLWFDSSFDNISFFTVTSTNAFCFGLDNFYINEEPPEVSVPEPGTLVLLALGLCGLVANRRRLKAN